MFEDEFAKLMPAAAPRRPENLPGLRLRGSVPKIAIILRLFLTRFFVMMPLSIMHADPNHAVGHGAGGRGAVRNVSSDEYTLTTLLGDIDGVHGELDATDRQRSRAAIDAVKLHK